MPNLRKAEKSEQLRDFQNRPLLKGANVRVSFFALASPNEASPLVANPSTFSLFCLGVSIVAVAGPAGCKVPKWSDLSRFLGLHGLAPRRCTP